MSKRFEKARLYTEKYKGKLSPCPECGNTDIQIWSDIFDGKYMWSVNCMTWACQYTWSTSLKKAIEKWEDLKRK
jgi:hypothetical protein